MNEYNQRSQELRAEMIQAFEEGKPIGDVSILKFAAASQPVPAGMNEQLTHVRGYAPTVTREQLSALPVGSFGRAYLEFLDSNGIQLMDFSPEILERFRDEPYPMRVGMTHDIHHMLVGGDAGIAGETAVTAFQVGQKTLGETKSAVRALFNLALGYTKQRPSRAFRVWSNLVNGWRLGRKTPLLIANRLEDMFELPLAEVRRRVGLPEDPQKAGIRYTDELDGKPLPVHDTAVDREATTPILKAKYLRGK